MPTTHYGCSKSNGTTVFSANTSFLKDAKIVITYHTFPKKCITDSTNKVSSEPVGKSTDESTKVINQEIFAEYWGDRAFSNINSRLNT